MTTNLPQKAIAKGLARRHSPGCWIRTSGAGILGFESAAQGEWGQRSAEVFDDCDNVQDLMSHDAKALHRSVDSIVLASYSDTVKPAIFCPPITYGPWSRAPQHPLSPDLLSYRLDSRSANKASKSEKAKTSTTISTPMTFPTSSSYSARPPANGGHLATWNDQDYYLAEDGSFALGDVL